MQGVRPAACAVVLHPGRCGGRLVPGDRAFHGCAPAVAARQQCNDLGQGAEPHRVAQDLARPGPGCSRAGAPAQSRRALAAQEAGQIVTVALDGKTLRDSLDRAKGVSAPQWLAGFTTSGQRLVLGQVAWGSGEKGYEINAVQRLIEELGMEGVLFTLDALHCQKKTLEFVVDSDCDLLVQVKANQPTLLKTIEDLAKQEPPVDTHKNHQRGLRIRIEARQTSVWHLPEQCLGDEWWPMRCLIQVCRHTDVFNTTQGNWEPRSETASPAPGYLFTGSTP